MEATLKSVPFHIPPIYIFVGVILSCLITGFFVDCVMQRYGCCGDKGGCCRKASEDEVVNEPGDAAETSHLAERSGTANNPIEPV